MLFVRFARYFLLNSAYEFQSGVAALILFQTFTVGFYRLAKVDVASEDPLNRFQIRPTTVNC